MGNAPDLQGYVEVKDRIALFREKHPDGRLRPVNPEQPYALEFIEVSGEPRCFIVYAAAAYRTADDPMPGIGVAWEPFPGKTPYTRDSELMNAETSAWGRAIVAALAADAGPIATAEDVKARSGAEAATSNARPAKRKGGGASEAQVKAIWAVSRSIGWDHDKLIAALVTKYGEGAHPDTLTKEQASHVIEGLKAKQAEAVAKVADDLGATEVSS